MNTFILLSTLYYETAYKLTHNVLLKKKITSDYKQCLASTFFENPLLPY